MYEVKPRKNVNIEWKSLLIKLVILLVAVFIVLWIVSLVKKDKKVVESNLSVNLQSMKTAASEYFTGSRLPSNVNGRKKITLNEMFESKMLVEFKDQNNNSCDGLGSYAEATKVNNTDYTIKVKLVCGEESDYVVDTVSFADNNVVVPIDNNPTNDIVDNNQSTTNNTNSTSTSNNTITKPNNSGTSSSNRPTTSTSTTKPNNVVANNTCSYGTKDYTSTYPLAYVIPGNCAVAKTDYYNAEYANKVSSITATEYKKLNDEMTALKNKTGVNLYLETNYYAVYNKSNKGLVGYQVVFTMKQKVNYAVSTVYEYYLDYNGNRTVVIDRRNYVGVTNSNNNNNSSTSTSTSVSSISLNKTSLYLDVNETYNLIATVSPSSAINKTVSWKSSNTSVATVSSTGKVKAIKSGSATITATAGGKSVSARVYVNSNVIPVNNITLNRTYLYLDVNESYNLTANVTPSNATYKTVSWRSSNTNIVTVTSNGVVKALKGGSATITATADGKSASVTIYVNNVIPVTKVSINKTSLSLKIGETYTLSATVTPSNATNKSVSWSSSNTSVATISSTGKVTAKKVGSTLIRATVDGLTTSIWVYVEDNATVKYCKKKTQTDYFMAVEQPNKYTDVGYRLEYDNTNMKNVNVINAGYLQDSDYEYARTYFNNPRVTVVTGYNYLNNIPTNYKIYSLKKENFSYNITQTYQRNYKWYIDVSYKVNNYNNVYSHYSYYAGNYIYYIPLFFQIEYIDLNDCISESAYRTVSQPWNYKKVEI